MTTDQAKESPLGDIETMIIMSLYADNLTSHHKDRISIAKTVIGKYAVFDDEDWAVFRGGK